MGKTFPVKLPQELHCGTDCVDVDIVRNNLCAGKGTLFSRILSCHFFMNVMVCFH
jgi:hypothetical protein